jgi:hypothetical protein
MPRLRFHLVAFEPNFPFLIFVRTQILDTGAQPGKFATPISVEYLCDDSVIADAFFFLGLLFAIMCTGSPARAFPPEAPSISQLLI